MARSVPNAFALNTTRMRARPPEPKVTVVVPARNEARNLEVLLPTLPQVHEVILVDGHSVDDTIAVAQRIMPGIRVIQQGRRGKGNALAHGFAAATGDVIVMFDADGSADPAEISRFVGALTAGADFAKGTRFAANGSSEDITAIRSTGNAWLNRLANRLFKTKHTDLCYGYNAFWVDILPTLDLPSIAHEASYPDAMHWGDGFEIETLISCRISAAKLQIVEVASVERVRMFGRSNLNAVSDGLRVLRTLWFEYRRARPPASVAAPTQSSQPSFGLEMEQAV